MTQYHTEDNRPLSEIYYQAAQEWSDLEAAAQLLEDTKSAVLAQKCAALGGIAVNRAEQTIKGTRDWQEHIEKIVRARQEANLAKVRMEYLRMKFQEAMSQEANHRAGARM